MKLWVSTDEMYPVYLTTADEHPVGIAIELTDEEFAKLNEAWASWEDAQTMLSDKYDAAGGRDEKGFLRY